MTLPRVFPSVVHMLAEAAAKAPAREAVAMGGERLSYAEYARGAAGLALELQSLGIGVADSYRGEIVKAYVSLTPGASASVDDFLEHCRKNLAKHKIPAALEIVPDLPKTAVGKIDKKALKGVD